LPPSHSLFLEMVLFPYSPPPSSTLSHLSCASVLSLFFFFNATATTEIYTLSLHDALPISARRVAPSPFAECRWRSRPRAPAACRDRKSTRLNSSHGSISYAVFCLKKKKREYHNCRHDDKPRAAMK